MNGIDMWILDDVGEPKPATWDEWIDFQRRDTSGDLRRVLRTSIQSDDGSSTNVSTVFLGIDHNFSGGGPPILFETMIFVATSDDSHRFLDYQERYATRAEAIAGHTRAVDAVLAGSVVP